MGLLPGGWRGTPGPSFKMTTLLCCEASSLLLPGRVGMRGRCGPAAWEEGAATGQSSTTATVKVPGVQKEVA